MSSINPFNIDGTYPIAGQDNDSQGFRDNFTNIQNNLKFAKAEIEDLQSKALLKSQLSGTTLDNTMAYSQLKEAQLVRSVETIINLDQQSGTVTVDWGDAHFQLVETDGDIDLEFSGWPDSSYHTKLRLLVNVASTSDSISLPAEDDLTDGYIGLSDIAGVTIVDTATRPVINFNRTGFYLFEFSTWDNGDTIIVRDLLRNRQPSYQYLTPTAGSYANISASTPQVIINPAGTIASANINFPANTSVLDGQTISFAFGATITSATMFGNGATISGGLTTAGVTTPAKYIYKTSTNTWYRTV